MTAPTGLPTPARPHRAVCEHCHTALTLTDAEDAWRDGRGSDACRTGGQHQPVVLVGEPVTHRTEADQVWVARKRACQALLLQHAHAYLAAVAPLAETEPLSHDAIAALQRLRGGVEAYKTAFDIETGTSTLMGVYERAARDELQAAAR